MNRSLCFVLMPFGKKLNAGSSLIDFDAVYHELIRSAIEEAGLEGLRAKEEMTDGISHNPRFESLILCEYAVERRIASGKPDYWDHANRLELAV